MTRLTDQLKRVIDDFKRHIEVLPANERVSALKEMTEYLSRLNEEAKAIVERLNSRILPPENTNGVEDIHDFK